MKLDFAKGNGLVTAVVQDIDTQKVLMVGCMNAEAFRLTQEQGFVTFFSRSRQRLWMKGETSGNRLCVHDIEVDCDADTVLVHAAPEGPVCHTGAETCFGPGKDSGVLARLEQTIEARRLEPVQGSYTATLFEAGIGNAARKVGEEATELVVEALTGPDDRLLEEAADLVFHLLVLLRMRDKQWAEVLKVLKERRKSVQKSSARTKSPCSTHQSLP